MATFDDENKIKELKFWAKEAMELLDEVKPYRSVFYKQRVAKLKDQFGEIASNQRGQTLKQRLANG
jgi:hypothetical protein